MVFREYHTKQVMIPPLSSLPYGKEKPRNLQGHMREMVVLGRESHATHGFDGL